MSWHVRESVTEISNGSQPRMKNNFFNSLFRRLNSLPPAWRASIITFLAGRILYTLWSVVVLAAFPTVVNNTSAYNKPVVLAFDLKMEKGYAYSRRLDGTVLTFQYFAPGQLTDTDTHSIWSLEQGAALDGKYAGQQLASSDYTAEAAFGPQPHSSLLLELWERYDTDWYLKIAQAGYDAHDGSMAYLPLFPLLIRLLGGMVGDDLLAALLISNLALLLGLYFLYSLTSELMGPATARRTLIYFVIFPTSFFFYAAYTESVFFLWVVFAFHAARRQRWVLAGILGMLATLTRIQGVLVIAPLLFIWYRLEWKKRGSAWHVLPLLLMPLAFLAFQLYTGGNFTASLQTHWLARASLPWENFILAIRAFFEATGSSVTLFNLVVGLGFLCMCIPMWKRLPKEFFFYTALVLLVPLFRTNEDEALVSYGRYALAAFPVFMLLGCWGKKPWVNRLVVYLGLPLALYFCARFLMWSWVG
jgi:hypothetical protein